MKIEKNVMKVFLMLVFSEVIILLESDKIERLLLYIVFALFKSLAYIIYLFTFGHLKLLVF